MTHPSYAEIAKDWDLWRDYVDPAASMTIEEWRAMSIPDRISLQIETFGPEPESAPAVEQILKQTHVGGHFHEWGVEGGVIRVSRDELRPALECAYDRLDPNWLQFVEI